MVTWALLLALVLVPGLLLGRIARRGAVSEAVLAEQIDRLLPQTQCGQCGFPGCKPYALALARKEADIDQCPPGGAAGVMALAKLLDRQAKPVNPQNGVEKPKVLALIREQECIGCTKCIQACPVDAIIGAPKLMHTVLDASYAFRPAPSIAST